MDAIFSENIFSSIPRPSLRIPNRTKDIGGSVVPKEVTKEVTEEGFEQKSRIGYFDTYAPVARISTIRLLIAMASIHNLIIHHMDVKTAFLNGDLDEEAPKQWHQKFDEVVLSNGYLLNQADKCVYSKFDESGKGEFLSSRFSIKDMGEADVILVSTPMDTSEKLMPNNGQVVSQLKYSRVIGCLMYVMTCTRPDIAFVMGKLSRYTSNPAAGKEDEWLKNLLLENPLWSKPIAPISICCDRSATLAKAYSQMYNGKSRHLGVRHSMIRELITNEVISIEFVISQQNLVDHLTKGLARDLVIKSVEGIATGLMGFSVIMKCTSVAYGTSPDALDEYLQMGEHCVRDCLYFFSMCIIDLFTAEFLRKPDVNDIRTLYVVHNSVHRLLEMLGNIDCMHQEWIYCPKAWHKQFGRGIFEIMGANNVLTVLNHSSLFDDLFDDIAPVVPYEVNGVTFEKCYYLADGIYPQWATFVKSFTVARDEKIVVFKRQQESARKDVERAFGVLQYWIGQDVIFITISSELGYGK
nr:protein ALP1-like isoform X1 [Tanacetum cinerariifolium]